MLLKLYIYAYANKIHSSRKIAKETTKNIEVMWLCQKQTPDFHTIADFRKENPKALKNVFKEWNKICDQLELFDQNHSIDGSKFKAVNSKDQNFTLSKLDDRIKRIDKHIDQYLADLKKADQTKTRRTQTKQRRTPKKTSGTKRTKKPATKAT